MLQPLCIIAWWFLRHQTQGGTGTPAPGAHAQGPGSRSRLFCTEPRGGSHAGAADGRAGEEAWSEPTAASRSACEAEESLSHASARGHLGDTAPSEASQPREGDRCVVPPTRGPQSSHRPGDGETAGHRGAGGGEGVTPGDGVSFWGDEKVPDAGGGRVARRRERT